MKQRSAPAFFIKAALFALSFAVFIAVVVMPQYSGYYTAAILDKYDRAANLQGRKLVVVGLSNTAFGYDSQRIEESLGLEVVNVGLHGAFGLAFHYDLVKDTIRQGDIVLFIPLNYTDTSALVPDKVQTWLALENHPQLWAQVSPQDYPEFAEAAPTYLRRALDLWSTNTGNAVYPGQVYSRDAFNQWGDETMQGDAPLLEAPPTAAYGLFANFAVSAEASDFMITYLNQCNAEITGKGATMLVGATPVMAEAYPHPLPDSLQELQGQLQDTLDCPIISDFTRYVYPFALFFDTGAHLNRRGVEINTGYLIEDLQRYLALTAG